MVPQLFRLLKFRIGLADIVERINVQSRQAQMWVGRFRQIRRRLAETIDTQRRLGEPRVRAIAHLRGGSLHLHQIHIAVGQRQLPFYLAVGGVDLQRVTQASCGPAPTRNPPGW